MYLIGASGHAKVILDILQSLKIPVSGLYDDNPNIRSLNSIPVSGRYKQEGLDAPLIISIGDNKTRAKIAKALKVSFGNACHPSAIISPSAKIGDGTVIMQKAVIQADTTIGNHVIVNTGASVDHDCFIDNFVHISPGSVLAGNVEIGEGSHIGAGAVIIPGIKVGKWCKIGAGAVVIRNIPDNATAVGNPAKIIKINKDE